MEHDRIWKLFRRWRCVNALQSPSRNAWCCSVGVAMREGGFPILILSSPWRGRSYYGMHRWAVAGFAKARLASFIPMSPSPWGRSHQGIVMSSGCCLLDESENMIRCGDWFAGCLIGWVRVHFFFGISFFIHSSKWLQSSCKTCKRKLGGAFAQTSKALCSLMCPLFF